MKNIVIIFLLMGISCGTVAQKNVVKGTAFFFPIPTVFTFGGGYERLITDQVSIQINYKYLVYQMIYMGDDGAASQGITPEVRYYFGPQESYRDQIFVGLFTEFLGLREINDADNSINESYIEDVEGNMINPGILFGKNFCMGKRMHLEMFIGYKYKFISKIETHVDAGVKSYVPVKERSPGVRLGLNLAYSF